MKISNYIILTHFQSTHYYISIFLVWKIYSIQQVLTICEVCISAIPIKRISFLLAHNLTSLLLLHKWLTINI